MIYLKSFSCELKQERVGKFHVVVKDVTGSPALTGWECYASNMRGRVDLGDKCIVFKHFESVACYFSIAIVTEDTIFQGF